MTQKSTLCEPINVHYLWEDKNAQLDRTIEPSCEGNTYRFIKNYTSSILKGTLVKNPLITNM